MHEYETKKIRNIAIVGHLGSGKTTLAESLAFISQAIDKKGDIEHKNTISDWTAEEQNRLSSVSVSVIPVEWKGYKLNFFDFPGCEEFVGEVTNVLSIVKGAVLVIDATSGVQVGTERFYLELKKRNIPTIVVVNKMDKDGIKVDALVDEIHEKLGKNIVPFEWPKFKDEHFVCDEKVLWNEYTDDKLDELRDQIMEIVAESDEELMNKFFAGEKFTPDEMAWAFKKSLIDGIFAPLIFNSALKDHGSADILNMIVDYFPRAQLMKPLMGIDPDTNQPVERTTIPEEPFSGYVFKTVVDPFVGTISYFKVCSGVLHLGDEIYIPRTGKVEKIMALNLMRGKTSIPVATVNAADVAVLSKIDNLRTGDTICDKKVKTEYPRQSIPTPTYYLAIKPKNKADDDKFSTALQRLGLEDGSFVVQRNKETNQLLIGGQGNIHIMEILERMKNMFKVDVVVEEPKVVYRETVKAKAEAEGRYIKQSGGSGQYGVVVIRFEPTDQDFEFKEEVFGGAVPKNFFPAVEKGLVEAMEHGPIAGFPVIGIKCTLLDGKYHPVDSSEQSFKMAAIMSFRKACEENNIKAALLEPVLSLHVCIKDEYVGDVMGDMTKRRGRILGINPIENMEGFQMVEAEVPEVEVLKYTIDLKAMTQGSGSFTREFVRYEEVPQMFYDAIKKQYTAS